MDELISRQAVKDVICHEIGDFYLMRKVKWEIDKLPDMRPFINIENIPYLMHKEMDISISECQKAYNIAMEYLRNKSKLKG